MVFLREVYTYVHVALFWPVRSKTLGLKKVHAVHWTQEYDQEEGLHKD